jgi:hypothetical protein
VTAHACSPRIVDLSTYYFVYLVVRKNKKRTHRLVYHGTSSMERDRIEKLYRQKGAHISTVIRRPDHSLSSSRWYPHRRKEE